MTVSFDPSILFNYYQAKAGVLTGGASGGLAASTTTARKAPTPPWSSPPTPVQTSQTVTDALAGKSLIDETAAKLDVPGASADYKKLFAAYKGLEALGDVAAHIKAKGLTAGEKTRTQTTFANGLKELTNYISSLKLDQVRLTTGQVAATAKAGLGIPQAATSYVTPPLITGDATAAVPAFQGAVQFNIGVQRLNSTFNVPIDLSLMGSQSRTLGNVVGYINSQLQAAGVYTRVASDRLPGQPHTVTTGGKTVTMPAGPDQWALQIKTDSLEKVSFSPVQTAAAVYVAQTEGDPASAANNNVDGSDRQLLKFQTDTANVPAPLQTAGQANWVDGRVFAQQLGPTVKTVHATSVGQDGSVYMLADVAPAASGAAAVNGHAIQGAEDVALLKYDSAGKLLYTRTLGAASTATGMSLAVAADGKVAVAGSVTGSLQGAQDGPLNSGPGSANSDSFVTLYDAQGQELWTQRRGARLDDQASQVAFGADGTVYVAGSAASSMPGAPGVGGTDGYIEAFNPKPNAAGVVQTLFTQSFGTTGTDKPAGLVVDGTSLVTASVESGHAVLRRWDVSTGAPTLTSTRDLGDLQGGGIAGLALDNGQVVVAGTTSNAALSAGAVTRAYSGGSDGFVARVAANLSSQPTDALAYYGGSGDDKVTALSVANGQAYIAGSAGTDLPGQAAVGKHDGFLAQIDVAGGAVTWSRRFTGKDGRAAPTSIAVAPQGASVLDRIGLPTGALDQQDSQRLTAQSSLRAGDQFTVRANGGQAHAVTIDNADTLDTLSTKIQRALGFQAAVKTVTLNGQRQLSISPLNNRMVIEIGAGGADKNALAQLGLPEGVLRATTSGPHGSSVPGDGKPQIYGLKLSGLNLNDPTQAAHAQAAIAGAQSVIRQAYKDLVAAATPTSQQAPTAAKTAGKAPQYLTNQIASYQAALDRLTAGAQSPSDWANPIVSLF